MDIEDDRHNLGSNDRLVLILEDDPNFARVLLDVAHQNGYKGLIALAGESALLLARQYKPTAVTLDLGLRDMSGWAVLDRLKQDPETADIPVHIISVFEDGAERGQAQGAATYLTKPATREALAGLFARIDAFIQTGGRNLLVVEDDPVQREEIIRVVSGRDVTVTAVATGKEALAAVKSSQVDCVILDLGLPDVDGHKLIEQIHRVPGMKDLPIIVYTAAELSVNAEGRLRKQAKSIITKGGGGSGQKLLDEVSQFFGRVTASAAPVAPKAVFGLAADTGERSGDDSLENVPRTPATATTEEGGLDGHKVLVVDDDVRNIFALTALLERHAMEVLHAETGREAIELLHENPSLEVVLMDIMMPEMDGYQTMAAIRRLKGFDKMPIIALTAKAMKGDREACLAAGASDYIAKPVDPEQLLSLLRVWLRSSV